MRFWATQSRDPAPYYQHSELGYNYRMSNIVAGIGRGQLLHLDEHIAAKKNIYQKYKAGFYDLPLTLNPYLEKSNPNFWLSCVTINEGTDITPQRIIKAIDDVNAEARPIWKPMHMQPIFEKYDLVSFEHESVAKEIFTRGLCLPSDIKMTDDDLNRIITAVRAALNV